MLGRLAVAAALIVLSACAGMESAGRNARAGDTARASAPVSASTPTPAAPPAGETAPPPAAVVAAAPPASAPQTGAASDDNGAVVRGQVERQVPAPGGDPRSTAERMQDINAWDRCVTHVQAAYERDPMRPQLQSPEEYCGQSLGMANREAVPASRVERR